jgi:mRNA-degrading endonuclease toxin of MazEF toxin-antitoxin module
MIDYKQGDIILVRFNFADESGTKRRPAVIVSTDDYHEYRQEFIISAITSKMDRTLFGDYLLTGWRDAGLLYPSVATAIIRTVKNSMIERKLGKIQEEDLRLFQIKLREVLGL